MKRNLLLLLVYVCSCVNAYSQNVQNTIYYFEMVKVVKNGVSSAASGDGHYLAVNQKGLYECKANGSTQGLGFVRYKYSENGRFVYEGDAYLGHDLTFVFNNDHSRMNIYFPDGTIYAYSRLQKPSSQSSMRVYKKDQLPIPDNPVPDNPNYRNKTTKEKKICGVCQGTGNVVKRGESFGLPNKWCEQCKKSVPQGHYHARCSYCNGLGYYYVYY